MIRVFFLKIKRKTYVEKIKTGEFGFFFHFSPGIFVSHVTSSSFETTPPPKWQLFCFFWGGGGHNFFFNAFPPNFFYVAILGNFWRGSQKFLHLPLPHNLTINFFKPVLRVFFTKKSHKVAFFFFWRNFRVFVEMCVRYFFRRCL